MESNLKLAKTGGGEKKGYYYTKLLTNHVDYIDQLCIDIEVLLILEQKK